MNRVLIIILLITFIPTVLVLSAEPSSCVSCHSSPDFFDQEHLQIVTGWDHGIHKNVGVGCADCHGGNPDPAVAGDMEAAMNRQYAPNPYHGAPERTAIPQFCGRCHSNPDYMKQYKPDARVDEEKEYWTSQHGKALRKGDTKVATCIDCHGVHGILAPDNTESPVYPKQVALTCSKCHSDPKHMAGYKTADGRPLPIDQYARWKRSVHAADLLDREDLSAPTCNDCHGNHGASPPGLESIAFVCGQCHGREADLFRKSPKQAGFKEHDQMIAQAGGEGCAACHAPPDPAAKITDIHNFAECTVCHGNHSIVRPTVALLAPLPKTPCAFCHETPQILAGHVKVAEPATSRRNYETTRDRLLAGSGGRQGEALFNWLVGQALQLPFHTTSGEEGGKPILRPEFQRLFEKFRIGTTEYSYRDPRTGKEVSARVRRCDDCHSAAQEGTDESAGLMTAKEILQGTWELTALTARAERVALAAQRGGVEVRKALADIDQAVDSGIQLQVLVHTFAAGKGSSFATKQAEGMGHARAALQSGESALEDLAFRRKGLTVSLVIILLVLVALAFKIRQVSRR